MSLVNEVVTKAVEVGVATYLGNTFVSNQTNKKEKSPNRNFLGINFGNNTQNKQTNSRSKTSPNVSNSTSPNLNELYGFVQSIAQQLPLIIEKGGPDGKKWVKLAFCILIDLVGSGSLAVPVLGDLLDLATAPVMAIMLQALFGKSLITIAGLAEEILPGTDGIPTATIAWLAENAGYLNNSQNENGSSSV